MANSTRWTLTFEERFWAKVNKTESCWLWTAATFTNGYGQFFIATGEKPAPAHRVAYELLVGPIAKGLVLDHMCHVPLCVNPDHLRPCTQGENMQNRGATSRNTSGAQGVTWAGWAGPNGKWRAKVSLKGKHHHFGYFSTAEEAAEAARLGRLKLFTHNDADR